MEEQKSGGAGRPRARDLEQRVQDAVIEIYCEVGWPGFTFDAVARRAGVGKSALYLRWPTKERLLLDTLAARTAPVTLSDTGSVREDLLDFARQMAGFYLGPKGLTILRVALEAMTRPELLASAQQQGSTSILAARAIVHRGIARGELPAGTSATLLIDIVAGGVLNHVLATPLQLRAQMVQHLERYIEDLVGFVLEHAQQQARHHPDSEA
jgi:AcrR family transcriptional regulator